MKTNTHLPVHEDDIRIRFATPKEAPMAVEFMQKLGDFQKMRDAIIVTPDQMAELLRDGHGEVIFAEYKGEIKGFVFFCQHASAFIGKCVLYIDALYVDEDMRGKNMGKYLMQFLSRLCEERNYGRMEWACLDWNKEAWDFYLNMGSKPVEILTLHRLDEAHIAKLSKV